jgi:hypothetical protein
MIGVAAPWVLGTAAFGALVTGVLHFLSVRRPPTLVLPTMRFLPDRPVRAVSRSAHPSDLWLLLLRVVALLLAGIGMAGVTWNSATVRHGRVVVIDRSGGTGDAAPLRARSREVLREESTAVPVATRVVLVDSQARVLSVSEMRAFKPETLSVVRTPATLSSALLAAMRAASVMVRDETGIDSVALDIVSPLARSADDAALPSVRAAWPGRINLIEVEGGLVLTDSAESKASLRFIGAPPGAAVLAAVAAIGVSVRSAAGPDAAIRGNSSSSVNIEWPASGAPAGWTTTRPDTIGALVARGQALVWPFVRMARAPDALLQHAQAIAWWSDGTVAAIESGTGMECTRQVGVAIPLSGDALQGQSAHALLAALTGVCGRAMDGRALPPDVREMLAGKGGAAPASAFRAGSRAHTPFGSVMLLLALVLLSLEWWIRDRERSGHSGAQGDVTPLRKVA